MKWKELVGKDIRMDDWLETYTIMEVVDIDGIKFLRDKNDLYINTNAIRWWKFK